MGDSKIIEIRRIEVKELFGSFDYIIETNESNLEDKLLLLYGDNGSGKTTILKLIFYLLSSKDGAGHKTEISKIKFKEFSVVLSNNIIISAIRGSAAAGTYSYVVKEENKTKPLFSVVLSSKKENEYAVQLEPSSKDRLTYNSILQFLTGLDIKLFYLSDSRKSFDSGLLKIYKTEFELSNDELELRTYRRKFARQEEPDLVDISIKSLEYYYKSEVLRASNVGEKESNNIYLQIVEQITSASTKDVESLTSKVKDLNSILESVHKRTETYSKFGLVSATEYSQIKVALSAAGGKQEIIFNILEPFIRGLKAKLDALENIQRQLLSFTECLNSFLSYKYLTYTIQNGFNIFQIQTDELIDFKDLSSGEKQLILLFSNAILASSQATIFIIDEPEISLNIKWQRKLLNYLLHLTPNNNIQFVIATHSIELLTNQKNDVIKLDNLKKF